MCEAGATMVHLRRHDAAQWMITCRTGQTPTPMSVRGVPVDWVGMRFVGGSVSDAARDLSQSGRADVSVGSRADMRGSSDSAGLHTDIIRTCHGRRAQSDAVEAVEFGIWVVCWRDEWWVMGRQETSFALTGGQVHEGADDVDSMNGSCVCLILIHGRADVADCRCRV